MTIPDENLSGRFFERQFWQIAILGGLFGTFYLAYGFFAIRPGTWLGVSTKGWYLTAITVPAIHQMYIWLCWRGELYFKMLSKVFGRKAFAVFTVIFFLLISIRFFSIIAVCLADYQSLDIPAPVRYPLSLILHVPALYAIYSVARYFGMTRAAGEDHFKPEEYRHRPFVKQGMYKYSSNVMYVYVMLIFLAVAVFCSSKGGILLSLYMYATVWTHYFCTEKPDIRYIYSK